MTARLTYSADYPSAHESNWSLVNKILRFNHIAFTDIRELVITTKRGRFRSFYQYTDSEVEFSKLRKSVGLDEESIDIDHFNLVYLPCFKSLNITIDKDQINKLIFCQDCIKFGFHSPYFMSPLLSHCPIHSCKLLDSCPSCNRNIPNILSVDALVNPYGCPNCGFDLYENKNSFYRLDVTKIDNYINKLVKLSSKTEDWHWIFNFDRQVLTNTNNFSSNIINLLTNSQFKSDENHCFKWSYNDIDLADEEYWPITQLAWEEMPNMLQLGLKDSLFNILIDALFLYMETKKFKFYTKEIEGDKKTKIIDSWLQVWGQRVSRYKEFGRFRLLEVFISNKILDCNLYHVKGMFLMRNFEIFLVNVLYLQLHLTFLTAIKSKNEGFDLRCEIEVAIENTQFFSNKKDKNFNFFALIKKEVYFEKSDISFIKSMVNKSIKKSNIYKLCRRPTYKIEK